LSWLGWITLTLNLFDAILIACISFLLCVILNCPLILFWLDCLFLFSVDIIMTITSSVLYK
jgi:hypothetical protein